MGARCAGHEPDITFQKAPGADTSSSCIGEERAKLSTSQPDRRSTAKHEHMPPERWPLQPDCYSGPGLSAQCYYHVRRSWSPQKHHAKRNYIKRVQTLTYCPDQLNLQDALSELL